MITSRLYFENEAQKNEHKAPKKRSRSKKEAGRQYSGKTTIPEIAPSISSTSSSPILTSSKQTTAKESQNIHWDPDFSMNKTFESTKENVVMTAAAASARSEILSYTETIQRYQEKYIESAQKIADNYLEINKEIITFFTSGWWNSYWENPNQQWTKPLISPQGMLTAYTNIVSTFVGNTIRISYLVNESMLINMNYFRAALAQTRERSNDLASACMNITKILDSKSPDMVRSAE
jgi:hypothetical protein